MKLVKILIPIWIVVIYAALCIFGWLTEKFFFGEYTCCYSTFHPLYFTEATAVLAALGMISVLSFLIVKMSINLFKQ